MSKPVETGFIGIPLKIGESKILRSQQKKRKKHRKTPKNLLNS